MGLNPGVQFPAVAMMELFSLRHRVQIGFGAHPASYPTGTGACYPGIETAGSWRWLLTFI